MKSSNPHIFIAMSGGVDSSVAAALLVQQGYRVSGVMLSLWSEEGRVEFNNCCTPDAVSMARRVAKQLSISFQLVDVKNHFRQTVVQDFLDKYTRGATPNPCLVCNRWIRWEHLLSFVKERGGGFLATGHYARLRKLPPDRVHLLQGVDVKKDQSYVLSQLTQEQLQQTLFPLGEYTKEQVRALAQENNIPTAELPDSQDLCFLGNGDYRAFLKRHAPEVISPGPIFDSHGDQIGQHEGLAFYTIGQRKGLGLIAEAPLFVLDKITAINALIVGFASELGGRELTASKVNWISGKTPRNPFQADVKIRYKSARVPATISPLIDQRVHVQFDHSLRDITPGQAAVFYQGDRCLGGGMIEFSRK